MRTILRMMLLVLATATMASAQGNPDWHRAFPGFKIAGNLYYVGTADLAVYLIRTPQGNILINGDFAEDVPTIRKSIEGLGVKYSDTKIVLISHAHGDHDEGVGIIQKDTGLQGLRLRARSGLPQGVGEAEADATGGGQVMTAE